MSSPALQANLDPAGKVLDDPPAFLSLHRSYCCLQVRDSLGQGYEIEHQGVRLGTPGLGVVAIHPILKVSP